MWPLIVINSPERMTVPIGIEYFRTLYSADWALIMAGSVTSVVPVIIVFLLAQRHFISGIRLGAIKG